MDSEKSFGDFRDENGDVDWKLYDEYRVSVGLRCKTCNDLMWEISGYPRDCGECRSLKEEDAGLSHSSMIKCPHCKSIMDVYENDYHELFEDGTHSIYCMNCDEEFQIRTDVSFTFNSVDKD